jgi:cell division septum initiation protein DivIVA
VEAVLLELVTEEGYKAVDYAKLPLLLLQAVKDLKAENDALRRQLRERREAEESLAARLSAIEQQLRQK